MIISLHKKIIPKRIQQTTQSRKTRNQNPQSSLPHNAAKPFLRTHTRPQQHYKNTIIKYVLART